MIVKIPFAGFYNTWHDDAIDRELEQMYSDSSGNPNPDLVNHAFGGTFSHAHDAYAAAYAGAFLTEFGISGEFESMKSPREYDFETDRLFCAIPDEEMARILTETPRQTFDIVAAEWFTSRSGFMSHYSPDVDDWGAFAKWDHNQTGCLMAAYVLHKRDGKEFGQGEELNLMELWLSNGNLDNALSQCPIICRAANVASYLRTREERNYRRV